MRPELSSTSRLERTVFQAAGCLGASSEEVGNAQHIFDANVLTLGFARRFATYKRPNLLLHDPERLLRILTASERPVQLIIAGKAHPADQAGQAMVQEWMRFIQRARGPQTCCFLERLRHADDRTSRARGGYLAQHPATPLEGLRHKRDEGTDQRRPQPLGAGWLVGGSLYPGSGRALGDGKEHDSDPTWDAVEAEALYTLLELYHRDRDGIPVAWVARIRESMTRLTAIFSSNRTVRQYTEQYYLPAAAAYRQRTTDKESAGIPLVAWHHALKQGWGNLRFGETKITEEEGLHLFEIQVYLNGLDPDAVRVELYAEGRNGNDPVRKKMTRGQKLVGAENGYIFSTQTPSSRPASDVTARNARTSCGHFGPSRSRANPLATMTAPKIPA